jgi:hypothetical protein
MGPHALAAAQQALVETLKERVDMRASLLKTDSGNKASVIDAKEQIVAPGFIETAMTDVLNEKQKESILGSVPMGRLGSGAEVASAVVYLASPEAAYTTGQTLHVNGGMAMI